jgi:uncharacterized integral membrane protein (TIGR00698 family)
MHLTAQRWRHRFSAAQHLLPGTLVCGVAAMAAAFLSAQWGGPRVLYALLLGLALHGCVEDPRVRAGVEFCARSVLRAGIVLLGFRITLPDVAQIGLGSALLVAGGVAGTIGFGLLLARMIRRPVSEGVLTGGAVAICGASAAMAMFAVLPQTKENERFTLLTVVGVTLLSTVAMVTYPMLLNYLHADTHMAGMVLGGTIHDVAQVVAAGTMLGPEVADTATVVKLFRILLLAPAVFCVSIMLSARRDKSLPTQVAMPRFVIGFMLAVALASLQPLPASAIRLASEASGACLVLAIAAVGLKTRLGELCSLGFKPLLMLLLETCFLLGFVLVGVLVLRGG